MKLLETGAVVDGFTIDDCIHSGGMAHIYRVHYADGQRDPGFAMAMKVPRMTTGDGAENIVSFEIECQIMQVLQGHHVPRFVAAGDLSRLPYLVMEYVDGVTLRRFCRADTLLPLDQIVEIGFKCAMALGYVYRQGVIHRDVKPANLLAVMNDDQVVDVKITDFGSAFNQTSDATQVYRVGSLAYMSPEQLDGDTLDCRADLYSLAAVL